MATQPKVKRKISAKSKTAATPKSKASPQRSALMIELKAMKKELAGATKRLNRIEKMLAKTATAAKRTATKKPAAKKPATKKPVTKAK